ncbi:MAG: cytochrome c biogenesis protein CcdA [Actinobacteria bacterium]|nr:cytochrome c biogenesis protein CcdA [Actinomycetota bacterium]
MGGEISLLLALGSGSVSAVNPCGFGMLPAFVSFFLGEHEEGRVRLVSRLLRAIIVSGLVTMGFVLVFGAIGAAISLGSRSIVRYVPWLGLGVGVILIGIGAAILSGRSLTVGLHPLKRVGDRSNRSMVAYGVGFGLASVGCTLPVFLVVVAGALAAGGLLSGLTVFLSYALGMGLVILAVATATALGKGVIVRWFRKVLPYVERISGVGLLVAGGYLVYREVAFLRFAGLG